MPHATRIAALAAVAIPSFLLGMRSSPQDPAPKGAAMQRYQALKEIEQFAAALKHRMEAPWTSTDPETSALWSRRLAEAAIDAGVTPARDAYAQHVARTEELLLDAKQRYDAGRAGEIDLAYVRYHGADAKVLLERAQRASK